MCPPCASSKQQANLAVLVLRQLTLSLCLLLIKSNFVRKVAAPDASLAIDYGTTFMEEDMIVLHWTCRMQDAASIFSLVLGLENASPAVVVSVK